MNLSKSLISICLLAAGAWSAQALGQEASSLRDLPEEFEQLLPRGAISAIDEPRFVKAAEADMPDEAWVLGVVIDGQARAYSLNLLNRHEVVNDLIAGEPIAAVW